MAERYIICTRCKCKYINDDNHIKSDFGYSRLNERFKTCVKCRNKYVENKDDVKQKREKLLKEANESDGKIKLCNRCYQNKSIDEFVCPNGKTYNACYRCLQTRDAREADEALKQKCYEEAEDEFYYNARKMGLTDKQIDDEKGDIDTYAKILYKRKKEQKQ